MADYNPMTKAGTSKIGREVIYFVLVLALCRRSGALGGFETGHFLMQAVLWRDVV
jgi:hypothetical protein